MDNNIIKNNELEALNNCLNYYNLTGYKIHEYFQQDKRRTKQMYFLTDEKGVSLTGHWEYLELNNFISGYGKAFKAVNSYDKLIEQNNSLLEALKRLVAYSKISELDAVEDYSLITSILTAKEAIKKVEQT